MGTVEYFEHFQLKQFKGRNKLFLLMDFLIDILCADAR